jgi:hypothetical protein
MLYKATGKAIAAIPSPNVANTSMVSRIRKRTHTA